MLQQHATTSQLFGYTVVASLNSSLISYLSTQNQGASPGNAGGLAGLSGKAAANVTVSQAALQRAAGTAKMASATQSLDASQQKLAADLRAALSKAGVKLGGAIEFAVKSDGSVALNGSDADKAAMQAFLKADTSQPSFARRIATQAQDALKLSSSIQQSAAISQAAKFAKSAGSVMSLYQSLMQQAGATNVVFSMSATSSSLTYPGSLTASA